MDKLFFLLIFLIAIVAVMEFLIWSGIFIFMYIKYLLKNRKRQRTKSGR